MWSFVILMAICVVVSQYVYEWTEVWSWHDMAVCLCVIRVRVQSIVQSSITCSPLSTFIPPHPIFFTYCLKLVKKKQNFFPIIYFFIRILIVLEHNNLTGWKLREHGMLKTWQDFKILKFLAWEQMSPFLTGLFTTIKKKTSSEHFAASNQNCCKCWDWH